MNLASAWRPRLSRRSTTGFSAYMKQLGRLPRRGETLQLADCEIKVMVARPNTALGQIHAQIMWNRLTAVVEEQAQTMIRTAFSTSVREAGDLSAGVFDRHGRMLAQAVTGTPGHVNSMANAVIHFLDKYPLAGMKPGDHYITNDPWLTSGHLHGPMHVPIPTSAANVSRAPSIV